MSPTYPMTKCLNINQATTLLNKSCSMFLPRWIYDDLEGQVSISNSLALQARGWVCRAHTCPSLPTQWKALYCASSPFHSFCGALCLQPPGPWVNTRKMGPKDGSSPINQPGAVWAEKSGVPSTLDHNLGGDMSVEWACLFGPISSPRDNSWRSEQGPPCVGSLLLGFMGRRNS